MPAVITNLALGIRDIKRPEFLPHVKDGAPADFIPTAQSKALADSYFGTMLKRFRENAEPLVSQALGQNGVPNGDSYVVVMTPLAAYQSVDGWGSNLLVRTDITESATRAGYI
jgi:hypothetical protein